MEGELGARPLEGRGVFVINGVSWIMFDVLVPIGFCLMWILRPLTPYSGAVFQKLVFRLDETSIFVFLPRLKLLCPDMFLVVCWAALLVLPRTFEALDFPSYNASTTWTHIVSLKGANFKTTYSSMAWCMNAKRKTTYSSVAWRMNAKIKRT